MGVVNLIVLCSIILVVISEEIINEQYYPATTVTDTRYKRQTEIDTRTRERSSKLPQGSLKNAKFLRLVPLSKTLMPSKGRMIPVANYKPITPTNATEIKDNGRFTLSIKNNDAKITNDTETNETINSVEDAQSVDLPTLDKAEYNNENKENEETEKNVQELVPKIVTKKEENYKTVEAESAIVNKSENSKLSEVQKDIPARLSTATKSPVSNDMRNKLPNLLADFKMQHNIPHSIKVNVPTITVNENYKNQSDSIQIETSNDSVNSDTNLLKTAEVGFNANSSPLPRTTEADMTSVPKINTNHTPLTIKSKIDVTNETNDPAEPQKTVAVQTKTEKEKQLDVSMESVKIEPNEEVVIQDNNYEELFESSAAPLYIYPRLDASEFRPTQNRDSSPISAYNKYHNEKSTYEKPYSYNIKKYPDKYIVNTYDELGNNDKNIWNKSRHMNNAVQWNYGYNSYYQPQAIFGQRGNFNYGQGQYPNRIWRSWRNNQIVVRPKSTNTVNIEELYAKGYLTKARNVPAYTSAAKVIRTNVENQNISPYSYYNSPQLRSGY